MILRAAATTFEEPLPVAKSADMSHSCTVGSEFDGAAEARLAMEAAATVELGQAV